MCHNTGSANNPVVWIDVSVAGWANGHTGPVHHQESRDGTGEGCSVEFAE